MIGSMMRKSVQLTIIFAFAMYQTASQQRDCGSTFFSESEGIVTSPNFPLPYPHNLSCTYSIEVGRNNSVILEFHEFDLEPPLDGNCTRDWLMITCNETDDENLDFGKRYCGNDLPMNSLRFFNCPVVMLKLFSDLSVDGGGFSIEYTVQENSNSADIVSDLLCVDIVFINDSSRVIPLPVNTAEFSASVNCTYTISASRSSTFSVGLLPLRLPQLLDSFADCNRDHIMIGCVAEGETELNPNTSSTYCRHSFDDVPVPSSRVVLSNCSQLKLSIRSSDYYFRGDDNLPVIVLPYDEACGPAIFAGPTGIVTSPRFPLSYPRDLTCAYYVDVDRARTVKLTFLSFTLDGTSNYNYADNCDRSWLSVSCLVYGVSPSANPHANVKYCGGKSTPFFKDFSNCDSFTVNFFSLSSVGKGDFKFRYTVITPENATSDGARGNASFTFPTGLITSPGFPLSYPHNSDFTYIIEINRTSKVGLFFHSFNLEVTSRALHHFGECPYDWLKITCINPYSNSQHGDRYCGELTEPVIRSFHGCEPAVILRFVSDSSVDSGGFKIWYSIITSDRSSCGQTSYSDPSGLITSPNFPRSYLENINCTYSIDVGLNSTALLKLKHFRLGYPDSEGRCTGDLLLITCHGTTTAANPNNEKRFCGYVTWSSSLRYVGCSSLVLELVSALSFTTREFFIEYTVTENTNQTNEEFEIDCGTTLFTDSSGVINLPVNSKNYLATVNCTYTILTNQSSVIWLNFVIISRTPLMQSFQDCDRETLTVGCASEGETEVNPNRTRVYCRGGGSTPRGEYERSTFIFADCHTLKMSIYSNTYDNRETFSIPFAAYEPGEMCGNTLLSDPSGVIQFPRFPFQYPRSVSCAYTMDNSLVRPFVLAIDCLNYFISSWSFDRLTITCVMVNGTSMADRQLKREHCSSKHYPTTGVFPECRRIIIQFSNDYPSYTKAFRVRYRLGDNDLGCGTTLFTSTSGVINFPINPSNNLASVNCTYIISTTSNLSYILLDAVIHPRMQFLQSFQNCDTEKLTVGCVSEGGTELNPKTIKSICYESGPILDKFVFANCRTLKLSILSRAYVFPGTFAMPYSFFGPDVACGNTSLPAPSGVVSSPRLPVYYGSGIDCLYILDIGEVTVVSLSVDILDTDIHHHNPCQRSWLMITCLLANGSAMVHRLANSRLCPQYIYSMKAKFPACRTVHFSFSNTNRSTRYRIRYKADDHVLDCGDTLFTNSSGVINLPQNTVGYPVSVNCTYTISTNQSSHIWLTNDNRFFQSFYDCDKEMLTVGCISEGETELNPNTTKVFCSRQGAYSNFPRTHLVFTDCATLKFSIRSDEYTRQIATIPFAVVRPSELCGNTSFSAPTGTISSQRLPLDYPVVVNCLYVIESDHVDSVALSIDRLTAGSCDVNWLTISCLVNGTSMAHPMADRKLCGSQNPASASFSACSSVMLNFSSNYSAYQTGFTVRYRIGEYKLDCGATLFTDSSGVINLPVNPTNYPATVNCTYIISSTRLSHIWLDTNKYSLAPFVRSFQDCDRDNLTFGCVSEGETVMNPNTTRVFCHRGGSTDHLPTWSPFFIDCPTLTLSISSGTYGRQTLSIPFTVFGASELCGNTSFSAQYGVITSPRLPYKFAKVVNCLYVIENDRVNTVVLNIDRLNVGHSFIRNENCNVSWLTIACLVNETAMAHPMADRKLCGYFNPTVVTFPACLSVLLNFSSDYSAYETEFTIRYGTGGYDPDCGITSHSVPAGFITSPRFPQPYAANLNCLYSITGGEKKMISLYFSSFSLQTASATDLVDSCCCDWVTVRCLSDATADSRTASSRQYCGEKKTPLTFSFPNCAVVVLNFRSDSGVTDRGFKARYIVRDMDSVCGVSAYGPPSGVIRLPWNFTDFDVTIDCKYVINATESSSISLTIWSISLQSSVQTNCSRDWLLITPLNGQISTSLNMSHKSYDNKNVSAQLTFPGCTALQVLFHKDAETTGKTFRIEYAVTSQGTGASVSTTDVPSTWTEKAGTEEPCATRCRLGSDSADCICLPDTSQTATISISADNPVTQSPKCEVGCVINSDGSTCECTSKLPADTLVDTQINSSSQSGRAVGISLTVILLVIGAISVGAFLLFRRHRQKKRSQTLLQATDEDRAKMELLEADSTETGLLFGAHRNQGQDGSRYFPLRPMSTVDREEPSSNSNSAQNLSESQSGI